MGNHVPIRVPDHRNHAQETDLEGRALINLISVPVERLDLEIEQAANP